MKKSNVDKRPVRKRFWIFLVLFIGIAMTLNCIWQNTKFREFDDSDSE